MKNNKFLEIFVLSMIILIQTIIFIIFGMNKSYIHMDEAFSLGLSSYDKIKIQKNDDFYDTWHTKDYYEDYLVVNEDEKSSFSQVYENQKNDVHPPLYYLILRIAMGFHIDKFSIWSGLIINIIIYAFITIFMYLICEKILYEKEKYKEKSAILALISSLTIASLTNVLYIRMYALSTLNVVITTYLHLKLLDNKNNNFKLLFCIEISALAGSLTHYYYLFYLATLFLMFSIKYLKNKEYKEFRNYFITLAIAGIISIAIFPYSIIHMFFGYRGKGAVSNLANISNSFKSVFEYLFKLNRYAFNNMLFFIILGSVAICFQKKSRKIQCFENNKYLKYLLIPALVYFVLVAISSPWKDLRYILPICSILFVLVMIYLEELLNNILKEKNKNIIFLTIFLAMFIMPFVAHIKIQVLYTDKKQIVDKLSNELNIPTVYIIKSNHERFLDDILLFSKIDESYIAKDFDYTKDSINEILQGKDLSKGIIVFTNYKEGKQNTLNEIRDSLQFSKITYLKRMNACDIYYIKN